MKKTWKSPSINVENFEANEYVASCFEVVCNTSGYVIEDKNKNKRVDHNDSIKFYNTPCQHEVNVDESQIFEALTPGGKKIWYFTDDEGDMHAVNALPTANNHS